MKFQAFDTETINRAGYGEACLLLKMTPKGVQTLEFPKTFTDIFNFLSGGAYVAWNMDFDMRAIFHPSLLPDEPIESLALYGRATWETLKFQYIPGKFFDCWKGNGRQREGKRFTIYDLRQFYGSSLDSASQTYLPEASRKIEIPKGWYNEMDVCLRDHRRDSILSYATRDVEATQALADKLLNSISNLGLKPRRLSSCASLARLKYGKVLRSVKPPTYLNRLFQKSFYGGRIETRVLGSIGPCTLYDLHSAYPSVIAGLVDPSKGTWVESRDDWRFQNAVYGHYEITASIPLSHAWGPLALRRGSRVIYPVGVVRTSCGVPAIEALRKAGIPFSVQRAHEFFAGSRTPIFPGIQDLYLARKDPGVSLAIKLLLNSIYGLCAESRNVISPVEFMQTGVRVAGDHLVRSWESFGAMTNFILAQHITESIRMELWEVLEHAGKQAYFAATDGILVSDKFHIGTGPGLGEWGLKGSYTDGVILGSGRYLLRRPDAGVESYLRGFPARPETWDRLRLSKRRFLNIPCLETDSLRQWAGSFADDLNVLREFKRRLEISDDKRHWPRKFARLCDAWKETISSQPYITGTPDQIGDLCQSTPTLRKPSMKLALA